MTTETTTATCEHCQESPATHGGLCKACAWEMYAGQLEARMAVARRALVPVEQDLITSRDGNEPPDVEDLLDVVRRVMRELGG
jgi:hypothetical protein